MGDRRYYNVDSNPYTVNLVVFDNFYQINYSKREYLDEKDVMYSSYYTKARISGFIRGENHLMTNLENWIKLDPQSKNSFNQYNIDKIANFEGEIVECKLRIFKEANFDN